MGLQKTKLQERPSCWALPFASWQSCEQYQLLLATLDCCCLLLIAVSLGNSISCCAASLCSYTALLCLYCSALSVAKWVDAALDAPDWNQEVARRIVNTKILLVGIGGTAVTVMVTQGDCARMSGTDLSLTTYLPIGSHLYYWCYCHGDIVRLPRSGRSWSLTQNPSSHTVTYVLLLILSLWHGGVVQGWEELISLKKPIFPYGHVCVTVDTVMWHSAIAQGWEELLSH